MLFRSLTILVIILIFTGCGEPEVEVVPEGLLDKDKFTEVMVDVQLVEGMKVHKLGPKRERSPDMEAMYGNIFAKHEIEQKDFDATYDYYKSRPDEMELIYEQVLDSLSKLDVEVKKIYNTPKNMRDSLNLDSITSAASKRKLQPLK
ncbi:DUF4296 domain-containing protein [Cryomorphaceae bacterium 1068]|nr:DUF4296 domain-containing protein [Cryomorphaceae bacterium 1068]